jgi:hypothetical protein
MNSIVKGERNILHTRRKRKADRIGHSWHRKFLLKHVLEGKREERIDVNRRHGRKFKQLLDELNPLTPNDVYIYIYIYMCRTAPLTSRRGILYIFSQQIYVLNILNMLHILRFFLFKMPFVS